MPTTEEDLAQLEKDLRQFKIEFEQYFGGGRKRPPNDTEWRIEQTIKRYGDRAAEMSYAQRFHYSSLAQTYAKYRDIFRKRLKKREEGTVERHFGAAAREIEATRKARAVGAKPAQSPAGGPLCVIALADPDLEKENVELLYRALQRARKEAGENGPELSPDRFREFIRKKTQQLRKRKALDLVEYSVLVENGHVQLKARVKAR